jgi:hypothetical protein
MFTAPVKTASVSGKQVDGKGLLAHNDLIMAGDMNFTTSTEEVWGTSALVDSLAGFFKALFIKNNLVDVVPIEVVPTWHNGRSGDDGIAKRLDRIYVVEDLITSTMRYRTWVEYPYLSDHAPVFLQLGVGIPTVAYPFKLNPVWLREESFAIMVREVWNDSQLQQVIGAQRRLVGKLSLLKNRVKLWSKEKRLQDHLELGKIEEALTNIYIQKTQGTHSDDSDHL